MANNVKSVRKSFSSQTVFSLQALKVSPLKMAEYFFYAGYRASIDNSLIMVKELSADEQLLKIVEIEEELKEYFES